MLMENEKIRVLEVLDCYFPSFDGPTILMNNYAKCMVKRDDTDVEIMVPKYPKYKDTDNFPVHRIKSIGATETYRCAVPFLQCKSKKIIKRKENPFDIVHVHSPFLLGRHAIKMAKKKGIPSVITLHTKFDEDFDRLLKSKLLRKIPMNYIMKTFRMADYVICVSDGAFDTLQRYGYEGKNVKVIRHGTDMLYPENAEKLKERFYEREKLSNEDNVFLSVGRVVENKKLQLALNALKIVKEKGFDFKYLIVGTGSYEKQLKQLVVDLDLQENVKFVGKIMDRDLLKQYYLASDLFLFPSTFDTAGLVNIEAAALKLPTLMQRDCCAAEIIDDGVNGFLVEENPNAWADKIIEILSNKESLKDIKENAYNQVYRSWDSVVDEMVGFYRDLISEYKLKNNKR